jgi:Tol biopolymer transport system component
MSDHTSTPHVSRADQTPLAKRRSSDGMESLFMKPRIAVLSMLLVSVSVMTLIGLSMAQPGPPELRSTIAFSSSRDYPTGIPGTAPRPERIFNAAEIYLIDPATDPAEQHARRLTNNLSADLFPALSPDGKWIAFDSNRLRAAADPPNTSDLFVMHADGTKQTHLTRGSSASWSPDSGNIVFHASASGVGRPIEAGAGAATIDSDIFVVNVADLLAGVAQPTNITNNPQTIDDDPDWSPDGQKIVFTSRLVSDNPAHPTSAAIYIMRVTKQGVPVQDGLPNPQRLTFDNEDERAPAWSPDGTRIAYMCHNRGRGFEICVMNADGTNQIALTANTFNDGTPSWSPNGTQIVFHREFGALFIQLFLLTLRPDGLSATEQPIGSPQGSNAFANWRQVQTTYKP